MDFQDNSEPIPGWQLRILEVRMGCYQVSLTDRQKRRVELACFDAELAGTIQACLDWAQKVKNEDLTRNSSSARA